MQPFPSQIQGRCLHGKIRPLRASDLPLFGEHLLRLDAASRRDRFNGVTDDAFVAAYAAKCFVPGTAVIGYLEGQLVRGAAELHEQPEIDGLGAEIAFSVEHDWQHRGLGSRLFDRLLAKAKGIGCRRLRVTTHPQNEVMKALARRFNAKLSFVDGETVGLIELTGGRPLVPKLPGPTTATRFQTVK
jgi:GNAT superfamily N-acetyltransferase